MPGRFVPSAKMLSCNTIVQARMLSQHWLGRHGGGPFVVHCRTGPFNPRQEVAPGLEWVQGDPMGLLDGMQGRDCPGNTIDGGVLPY